MLQFIWLIFSDVYLSIYIDDVFNVHNDVRWAAGVSMIDGRCCAHVVMGCWRMSTAVCADFCRC